MAWINCGLDQGMKVVKGGPLRGTLFYIVVWIKAWKLSRVRGNYYILQNSWLGSIVVWFKVWKSSRFGGNYYILQNSRLGSIVVGIKAWKSSRGDRFTEHYFLLWFGPKHESCQGLEEIITSFRTHGLDHLWFGSRHESCQGLEEIITSSRTHGLDKLWFGSRHESRQVVTASRNTCSSDHLFSCSDKFVQLFLFNGQLFNSIFVQLSNV